MKGNILIFLSYNKEKIENLIVYLMRGVNYHNSEVALMFHDKIIGVPGSGEIIFNTGDGRTNKSANRSAIEYLKKKLIDKGLLGFVHH